MRDLDGVRADVCVCRWVRMRREKVAEMTWDVVLGGGCLHSGGND